MLPSISPGQNVRAIQEKSRVKGFGPLGGKGIAKI